MTELGVAEREIRVVLETIRTDRCEVPNVFRAMALQQSSPEAPNPANVKTRTAVEVLPEAARDAQ